MIKQIIFFGESFFKKISHLLLRLIEKYDKRLYWEDVAQRWNEVTSPARPSLDDIVNYRKALSAVGVVNHILVLGSTPELRILASEFAKQVTYVDFSTGMQKAMAQFVPKSVQSRETFFPLDWLSLNRHFADKSFGTILGDLVIRQIRAESLSKFFLTTERLLEDCGVFITRTNIKNPRYKKDDAEFIVSECVKNYFGKNDRTSISTAILRLHDVFTNNHHETDPEEISTFFKGLVINASTPSLRNQILWMWNAIGHARGVWLHLPEMVLRESYQRYFSLERVLWAHDYQDTEYMPLYVFKKRSV